VAGQRRDEESDAHSLSARHLTLHRTIADGGGNNGRAAAPARESADEMKDSDGDGAVDEDDDEDDDGCIQQKPLEWQGRKKQRLDAGAMLRGAGTKRGQIWLRKQEKVSAYLADHVLGDESLSQITSFDGPHVFWA
jgi:Rieske Fe-S protein